MAANFTDASTQARSAALCVLNNVLGFVAHPQIHNWQIDEHVCDFRVCRRGLQRPLLTPGGNDSMLGPTRCHV